MKRYPVLFAMFMLALGFGLGYLANPNTRLSKTETLIPGFASPTSQPATCAGIGEAATLTQFDETTGKNNPKIKIKPCCPGLKAIGLKQPGPIQRNPDACGLYIGGTIAICSPCGNDKCDPQYEDHCNCPVDCK